MAKGKFNGMPGNMNNMMKQVQKMQKDMERAQQDMELKQFEASAGGGAVKVIVNGKKEIVSIVLEPSVVDPDDIEMLQDLIMVAVNEALRTAESAMSAVVGQMTGGLNIPGLF